LGELDNERFEVRQAALKGLEQLGELAEPSLRKALRGQPSAEVRLRAEQLLARIAGAFTTPEQLRQLRAVETLEHLGTAEARALLEALAPGALGGGVAGGGEAGPGAAPGAPLLSHLPRGAGRGEARAGGGRLPCPPLVPTRSVGTRKSTRLT